MFQYFKNKARISAINKVRKKLKRKMGFSNLNSIKSVGIIIRYQFNIENEALRRLLDFFKNRNVKPELLIYYPEKQAPKDMSAQDNMLLFTEKDSNWFGKPNLKELDTFTNREFDLLIDLSIKHIYSLQYIVESSKASFKVGRISYDETPYDFVLLGDNENDSQYVKDLFSYLSKLNQYDDNLFSNLSKLK